MHSSEHRAAEAKQAGELDVYIATRLRAARNLAQLTQQQLAVQVGVSYQQIRKYETGATRISAAKLHELSLALGQPIAFFFPNSTEEDTSKSMSFSPQLREFTEFMTTHDAVELRTTFPQIKDGKIRRQVLKLVRSIADSFSDQAQPQGLTPPEANSPPERRSS